jgi:hypothetical protein
MAEVFKNTHIHTYIHTYIHTCVYAFLWQIFLLTCSLIVSCMLQAVLFVCFYRWFCFTSKYTTYRSLTNNAGFLWFLRSIQSAANSSHHYPFQVTYAALALLPCHWGWRSGHEIQINPNMGPFERFHTDSEAGCVEEGVYRRTLLLLQSSRTNDLQETSAVI